MELWDPTSNWFLGPSCSPSYSFFALISSKKNARFSPMAMAAAAPPSMDLIRIDGWRIERLEEQVSQSPMTDPWEFAIKTPPKTQTWLAGKLQPFGSMYPYIFIIIIINIIIKWSYHHLSLKMVIFPLPCWLGFTPPRMPITRKDDGNHHLFRVREFVR